MHTPDIIIVCSRKRELGEKKANLQFIRKKEEKRGVYFGHELTFLGKKRGKNPLEFEI